VGDDTSTVTGTNDGVFELRKLDIVAGEGRLDPGDLVVDQDTARSKHLRWARRCRSRCSTTPAARSHRRPRCPGSTRPARRTTSGSYVIGTDDFDAAVNSPSDAQIFVQLDPGVSVAEAQPKIKAIVDQYPTAEVQNVDEFKDTISAQFNPILYLIVVLLTLSVIIAFLGIANTIALSVLERTRELGLLRAVGMRRKQVRSAIRWESAIISLFGTVLGLAVGLLGGWAITRSLRDEGFEAFAVPTVALLVIAVIAGFLGLAAALIPAWRASRMDVLQAINTE
jgi:putative ABC transport system permease protein